MQNQTVQHFSGDKKFGRSVFSALETRVRDFIVPRIPRGVETYHLTLATIPLAALVVIFSFLARENIQWLWAVSACIFAQYLTDLLDGAVGRYRGTGLVRWGYFMDHFLDYTFLCAIVIGYSLIVPDHFKYLQLFILAVFAGFMVTSYLDTAASGEFRITHLGIGPTEIRLLFIAINTLLIIFGKTYLAGALPYALILSTLGLWYVMFRTQQRLWKLDMKAKKEKSE